MARRRRRVGETASLIAGLTGPQTPLERARAADEIRRREAGLELARDFIEDLKRRRGEEVTGRERTEILLRGRRGEFKATLPSRREQFRREFRDLDAEARDKFMGAIVGLHEIARLAKPVRVRAHVREGNRVEAHTRAKPDTVEQRATLTVPGERLDPALLKRLRRRGRE